MKFALTSLLLFTVFHAFSQDESEHHPTNFQEHSWSLGLGAPYSFEFESVGINARLYHNYGEQICFGAEFSYFKAGKTNIIDFDIIGHYIFETKLVGIYPLVGVNYTIEKEEGHEEENAFGLVYGAGIHRNFKNITCFLEYSRVESQLSDHFLIVGLMYTFK